MQTTKKSPFTQFDPNYYATLRRVSFAKAEEYRQTVIQGTKNTIDLWERFGKESINELAVRWISPENKDGMEKREILKARWWIDLAEQFEKGTLWIGNPLEENPEEKKQEPSIDLSLLITDPGVINEEEILGITPNLTDEFDDQSEENNEEETDEESEDEAEKSEDEENETEDIWEIANEWNEKYVTTASNPIELWESERKYIIDQLKARWQFVPWNIWNGKLVEKAKNAWIL